MRKKNSWHARLKCFQVTYNRILLYNFFSTLFLYHYYQNFSDRAHMSLEAIRRWRSHSLFFFCRNFSRRDERVIQVNYDATIAYSTCFVIYGDLNSYISEHHDGWVGIKTTHERARGEASWKVWMKCKSRSRKQLQEINAELDASKYSSCECNFHHSRKRKGSLMAISRVDDDYLLQLMVDGNLFCLTRVEPSTSSCIARKRTTRMCNIWRRVEGATKCGTEKPAAQRQDNFFYVAVFSCTQWRKAGQSTLNVSENLSNAHLHTF